MNDEHTRYLEALRARHAADLEHLGKRRGRLARRFIAALRARYAAQEKETEGILAEVEAREPGSPS